KVLNGACQGKAVGGNDADITLIKGHGAFVNRLGINHGQPPRCRGENTKFIGDTNIIAKAAEAKGDCAFADLPFFKWLDHALFTRHALYPIVRFNGHNASFYLSDLLTW